MNKNASLDYRIYQTLIESDLTDEQKQYLIEVGIGQTLKSVWGGLKAIPSAVADVFKSGMYNVQLQAAQINIQKELEELKKIGKKLGKGDEFVNEFLFTLMKGAGVNPSAVASSGSGAAGPAATGGSGQLQPGTKISASDNDVLIQALSQVLANITGKPAEEVQQQAQDKKIDAVKMTSVVATQASEKLGVPAQTVQKVVNALIKTGHLVMESVAKQTNDSILIERWQRLAGLVSEGNAAKSLANDFKNKKITTADELEQKLKGFALFALQDVQQNKGDIIAAWKSAGITGFAASDLEKAMDKTLDKLVKEKSASEGKGTAAYKNLSQKIEDGTIKSVEDLERLRKKYAQDKRPSEEELGKLMDSLVAKGIATPQEKEKEVKDAATGSTPGGKASPENSKKAADAVKKFASAAKDVRKQVPDIDDETLGIILNYFDELPSLKIN